MERNQGENHNLKEHIKNKYSHPKKKGFPQIGPPPKLRRRVIDEFKTRTRRESY
ncbi:hypothetical protein HFA01_06600 [Halobacillus faecis]|uniref:Uncharacterized protein n=1 Tax=Halobacillus faecis TaxID=360184 RepID=A0A511WQ60_9BACI|nr:hypothetical protein HFA01_06600 [Halobacillus faecis]